MTPIPGEPLDVKPLELRDKHGRKVKLVIPGMAPPAEPKTSAERGSAEPPRDDPRPPIDPGHAGL